jgi:hypothetical protein
LREVKQLEKEFPYNFIREAILNGRELHFYYKETEYAIAHWKKGSTLGSEIPEHRQEFLSALELIENATINGKKIEEIWDEVTVISLV